MKCGSRHKKPRSRKLFHLRVQRRGTFKINISSQSKGHCWFRKRKTELKIIEKTKICIPTMLKPYSASSFCLPNKNRVGVAHGDGTNLEVVYTCACLQYTLRTTSHHAAPWRAVLRSTVRIKSHQFAPIEQCSIFCARPRDFAAARLRLQAKLGLFTVLGKKGLSKPLVQTNGFCYPSSSSFFCTSFVVFLVKTALLFFK